MQKAGAASNGQQSNKTNKDTVIVSCILVCYNRKIEIGRNRLFMSTFIDALIGEESAPKKEHYDLFGQFIGEWDFEWVDGKGTEQERHVPGEWIFSWILNGRVIQDLFICPSRKEKERINNPQPDGEYGTTVRFFNAEKQKWVACYGYDGNMYVLEAEQKGNEIILTNQDKTDGLNQWMFTDITPDSFHWMNRTLIENDTWRINGELFATRRV